MEKQYHIKIKSNISEYIYCVRLFVKEENLENVLKFYQNNEKLEEHEEIIIEEV